MKINWMHYAMLATGAIVALCGYMVTADPAHVAIYKTVGAIALTIAGLFGGLSPSANASTNRAAADDARVDAIAKSIDRAADRAKGPGFVSPWALLITVALGAGLLGVAWLFSGCTAAQYANDAKLVQQIWVDFQAGKTLAQMELDACAILFPDATGTTVCDGAANVVDEVIALLIATGRISGAPALARAVALQPVHPHVELAIRQMDAGAQ